MTVKRVVGICFDQMHIGDLLEIAQNSKDYQVVGVYDPTTERMTPVCSDLEIPQSLMYTDWEEMLQETRPDLGIVCSVTDEHTLWTKRLAERGIHVLLEKPFSTNTLDAEEAIRVANEYKVHLCVNWPLAWYDTHRTTKALIDAGEIGEITEVHYYDGNRGPLYHLHGKKEVTETPDPNKTWWYSKTAGGGSLLDYLGYGVTIGTWFRNGEMPEEITAVSHIPAGYEVDEQSIVIARYSTGLSSFQTRWGTFTDPWVTQPQPFCGFIVVGTQGTIMSRDYATCVQIQTSEHPEVRELAVHDFANKRDIFEYLNRVINEGGKIEGPCGAEMSLLGQKLVDAAKQSAETRQPVCLK